MPVIKGANGATNDLPGMVAVQLIRSITLSVSGENIAFGASPVTRDIVVVPRAEAKHLPGFIVTTVPAGLETTYYLGAGA